MSVKRIFKYDFSGGISGGLSVRMPTGAQIISANMQDGAIRIWAIVDPAAEPEERYFNIFGTGYPMIIPGGELKFIATVMDDPFVWHVFERVNAEA